MPSKQETETGATAAPVPNGADQDAAAEAVVETAIRTKAQRLAAVLQPPPSELSATIKQALIPVGMPGPLEFIRTHPEVRLTLNMTEPKKGPGSSLYAVMPEVEGLLARYNIRVIQTVLYPVLIASAVPTYRLVPVKFPPDGKRWDTWNLTRKILLDKAINEWLAIRSIEGGYGEGEPAPGAIFPEVTFPEWTSEDWLDRSLVQADLVIWDDKHPIIKAALHLA
jgi:hypothetical protein